MLDDILKLNGVTKLKRKEQGKIAGGGSCSFKSEILSWVGVSHTCQECVPSNVVMGADLCTTWSNGKITRTYYKQNAPTPSIT